MIEIPANMLSCDTNPLMRSIKGVEVFKMLKHHISDFSQIRSKSLCPRICRRQQGSKEPRLAKGCTPYHHGIRTRRLQNSDGL